MYKTIEEGGNSEEGNSEECDKRGGNSEEEVKKMI